MDQSTNTGTSAIAALFGAYFIFVLIVAVILIIGFWKIFTKAGQPGWAAIIPIYNIIVLLEIIGRPTWWIILCLIPCVNIVALIMINLDLAKVFGKGSGFGIGLILLPIIFVPILGFGDATYTNPKANTMNVI